jgi:hypothetical protein
MARKGRAGRAGLHRECATDIARGSRNPSLVALVKPANFQRLGAATSRSVVHWARLRPG